MVGAGAHVRLIYENTIPTAKMRDLVAQLTLFNFFSQSVFINYKLAPFEVEYHVSDKLEGFQIPWAVKVSGSSRGSEFITSPVTWFLNCAKVIGSSVVLSAWTRSHILTIQAW